MLEDSIRIEVEDDFVARLSLIEPLELALVFPPPLSPRNDLNHLVSVMITGLPAGTILSAGASNGDGRWSCARMLGGITITQSYPHCYAWPVGGATIGSIPGATD